MCWIYYVKFDEIVIQAWNAIFGDSSIQVQSKEVISHLKCR
jgi:hypothetical protein